MATAFLAVWFSILSERCSREIHKTYHGSILRSSHYILGGVNILSKRCAREIYKDYRGLDLQSSSRHVTL